MGMSTAKLLAEEIASRIETFLGDSQFQGDNPGMTQAEMEQLALEDIERMGPDYGGAIQFDPPAEQRKWKAIYRAAVKRLNA